VSFERNRNGLTQQRRPAARPGTLGSVTILASNTAGIHWWTEAATVISQYRRVFLERALIRPGETARRDRADSPGPVALINDPRLLETWTSALRQPADGGLRPGTDEEAKADLGSAMFHFALGGFAGLGAFESASDLTDPERRRVRRHLEAAVEHMPNLPAVHRLAVIGLVLCSVQADVWDGPLGDQGWIRVVSRALENVDRDDIPERISDRAASWAAIAVYLLYEHRPTIGRPAEVLMYEDAAAGVSHLLPDADPQLIADFAGPFTNKSGAPIDPDAVMHVIGMIVQGDPLAEAVDILGANRPAWQVHKHNSRLLHVHGDFRATFLPAAEGLDAVPGMDGAAVWATSTTAGWTIAIRDAETLIRIEKNRQGQVTWQHYRLGALNSPTGIARDSELASRVRIRYGALSVPFPAAIASLTAIGADLAADPPSDCPPGTI
jgi:hypothetical protein